MSRSPPGDATIIWVRASSASLASNAGLGQRHARGIAAVMHQRAHGPLVALARNEAIEIEGHHGIDGVGCAAWCCRRGPASAPAAPRLSQCGCAPLAQGRDQAAAGDPDFASAHARGPIAQARIGTSRPRPRHMVQHQLAHGGAGKWQGAEADFRLGHRGRLRFARSALVTA